MTGISFDDLREANQRRLPDFDSAYPSAHDDEWTLADWAVAAAGEMGEMCNLIKKVRRGEDVDTADIGREIADTITYLDFVAWKLGIDMGDAVASKFNEVSLRVKSPVRMGYPKDII